MIDVKKISSRGKSPVRYLQDLEKTIKLQICIASCLSISNHHNKYGCYTCTSAVDLIYFINCYFACHWWTGTLHRCYKQPIYTNTNCDYGLYHPEQDWIIQELDFGLEYQTIHSENLDKFKVTLPGDTSSMKENEYLTTITTTTN